MRKLEEFVNEKLRVSANNDTPDIPLGEQGWRCVLVNSMHNAIRQIDNFLKLDIDLMRLSSIDTEDYTDGMLTTFDKVFQALKRRKWCNKIINVILSEYTFEEGVDRVQELLRRDAKCNTWLSNTKIKRGNTTITRQIVKITDSNRITAMILAFDKA